jgi:hypothetical protein
MAACTGFAWNGLSARRCRGGVSSLYTHSPVRYLCVDNESIVVRHSSNRCRQHTQDVSCLALSMCCGNIERQLVLTTEFMSLVP